MTPYGIALALATALHLVVLAWLWQGIRRGRRDGRRSSATPPVSIVVAARNERHRIGACLLALQRQEYAGSLEIVVVDDRSTDGTGSLLGDILRGWQGAVDLRLVTAAEPPRYACPKKSALSAGIEASGGDLLLFTDADCEPPPGWVSTMVSRFTDDVGLVAGFACGEPLHRLRDRLLAVDNLGVQGLGEGSAGMGRPLSCTGRNLAYRRRVWDEVGGFDEIGHLVSGDDVYFLRLVSARTTWRVTWCADPRAVVTGPPGDGGWRDVVQQKLRHASKAARYGGGARWLGAGLYAYHGLLAAGLAQGLLTGAWHPAFWPLWLLRWTADASWLAHFAPRGRRDRLLITFLPLVECLYLPYVLFFVPLGRAGWFRWKRADALTPPTST